jgi:hypothetical protein
MGFLHEVQFASEEIIEVNQFRIALNDLVGALLERQADIESETVLAARSDLP